MDPQFLQRLNALQNFQNQQTNQATQAELAALREQLAEEANKPKCPHCGGPSEKGFDRCKNCGQEVIWCGHFVGKPGTMDQLEMAMQQYELGIKRAPALEMQRQQAAELAERKVWEARYPGHKWEDRVVALGGLGSIPAATAAFQQKIVLCIFFFIGLGFLAFFLIAFN
jgi:hypothetical protein